MIINPSPETIAEMWWEAKDRGMTMVVLASSHLGEDIQGHVIGRGSMMRVTDPETGQTWEDVRPEWVYSATLIHPRN